jgi:RNA polymerase sigma factor (sigma-70 family)
MSITALSDAELLAQARGGDEAAFTELYVRHQAAAHRLASTYKRMGDPEDLVNGAFERVLGALRRGAGPTESFRAYLFVTLRRLAAEQGQKPADRPIDEVPEPVSDEADAPELAGADKELITKAFETLPDRWQAVLWHTAVEGRRPRELASVLGVSANAAAAMAYRAREKLRQAYLQAHLAASPAPEHEPYRSQLGAYVRDGLSARDKAAVERHLAGCDSCRALAAELEDVNRVLVRSVVPLFVLVGGGKLAMAGAGAAAAAGTAASSGSGSGSSSGGFVGRGAQKVRHMAPTVGSVAAIAALVAGTVGLAATVSRGGGGPFDNPTAAADIGPTGAAALAGAGAGSGAGGSGGSGLFGAPDGAVGPPAATEGLGSGDFGSGAFRNRLSDLFGSSGGSGSSELASPPLAPASGPTPSSPNPPASPSSPSPPPSSGGPPATPPPGGGPGSPPGGGGTTTPPPPPPLAFSSAGWLPTAVGQGDLAVTVGEKGASAAGARVAVAAATVTAAAATADPLKLQVTLTPGARARPGAALDPGCTASGSTISCSLAQPPKGGSAQFSFPLQIDAAGQTATLTLFRGTKVEAKAPAAIPLSPYEQGLDLTDPSWSPFPGRGQGSSPAGQLAVGAVNRGDHAMAAPSVTITISGGAFVPPALFPRLDPSEFLDLLPLPPGQAKKLLDEITAPLPAGCDVVGWTPPAGEDVSWESVLRGGLPSTISCDLADLAPGATASLGGLLAAVRPLYVAGDGVPGDPTAVVTLRLGDSAVGTPRSTSLAVRASPGGGGGGDNGDGDSQR